MGLLLPLKREQPRFTLFYIYDTMDEVSNRLSMFGKNPLDVDIVKSLIEMLDSINELVKLF